MSKAVLISIRTKECDKICSGEKTVEVRKTRPNLKTPFKCYIYCTQSGDVRRLVGERDKVIGEFVCDRIDRLARVGFDGSGESAKYCICNSDMFVWSMDGVRENACLTQEELEKYLGGYDGYGWHISDLVIYDTPRNLGEFAVLRTSNNGFELRVLDRAPQSWCYVGG